MTITTTPILLDGRSLLDEATFDRLERRIRAAHPELAPDMPARILDQALAFLGTCAVADCPLGPSEPVDKAWHEFILDTVKYAEFGDRIAGRFIHHVPDDDPTATSVRVKLSDVVAAITAAGYLVDEELWPLDTEVDCTQCHAGCHDSPTR